VLPKLFSTATHIVLLYWTKKIMVLKRKKYFYLLLNIILQPVGSRVRCALWSSDGSTELRPIAYLRCGRCRIPNPYNILGEEETCRIIYGVYYVLYSLPFSNFLFCFFTSHFLWFLIFYIIKKSTFQELFATHHKSARDPPVWETLRYVIWNLSFSRLLSCPCFNHLLVSLKAPLFYFIFSYLAM
jgi:hypothetical protein